MMSFKGDTAIESSLGWKVAWWVDAVPTLIIWDDSSTSVNKVKRTRRWVQTNQTELMEEQQRMTAVGLGRHGDARYGRDDEEGSH